eukprot:8023733-Pyramimonas_sp.AAC.1
MKHIGVHYKYETHLQPLDHIDGYSIFFPIKNHTFKLLCQTRNCHTHTVDIKFYESDPIARIAPGAVVSLGSVRRPCAAGHIAGIRILSELGGRKRQSSPHVLRRVFREKTVDSEVLRSVSTTNCRQRWPLL